MTPRAARATLVALAIVATALGPAIAAPGAAASTACTRSDASGTITVALVVDSGSLGGGVRVDCVDVPKGARGTDVLAARAATLGVDSPRYDNSGLLCAIDGVPAAPACGAPTGSGGYAYWSYWLGGPSGWTYAPMGPATRAESDGSIEGWHFISGTGTRSDDGPSIPPSAVGFATRGAQVPTVTTPMAVVDGGAGGGVATPGSGATATGSAGPARSAPTASAPPAGSPPPMTPAHPGGEATSAIPPLGELGTTTTIGSSTVPSSERGGTTPPQRIEIATAAVRSPDGASSTSTGAAGPLGGLAVFALAVAALVLVVRRRRAASP